MRSPRLLTLLLVVLVVVPAAILGWLGIRGTDRFETEMRQRLAQELAMFSLFAKNEIGLSVPRDTFDADARMAATADLLSRRLPFEPVGRALAAAKASLHAGVSGPKGTTAEFDNLWSPERIEVRIVDAASRVVLPVSFDPDGAATGRGESERLFDDLAREADAAAFGRGALPSALEIWRSAGARFTEPAWKARAEIEAALLAIAAGAPRGDVDALLTDLEARFGARVLARVGRPWVLLLLRVASTSKTAVERLRALDANGLLAEAPMTGPERSRVRELVGANGPSAGASGGGWHDVHRAALPDGLVLEVTRHWPSVAAGPSGVLYQRLRLGASPSAEFELHDKPPGLRFTEHDLPLLVEILQLPSPGFGGLVLRHRDEARLLAEVESSRRWTIVGVLSLVGVIGLGLLVGRTALAREREARRLKDDFLANVSHELRTPLTSVCLHADLLAEAGVPDAQRLAHAEVVRAEGARLSALVDDLLDFAALERGARRLEPEPVDLGAAAERALAPFRVLAARDGATLTLDLAPGELLALADPHALGRVLSNLVGNAWKHGRPSRDGGPGRLAVRVTCADDRPTLDVVDDGPGIPPNERPRLFERFQRGAAAGKTRGVGLGLALSRDLARALGGDLVVVEDPAHTVFRLTLPPVPPLFPSLSDAPPSRPA